MLSYSISVIINVLLTILCFKSLTKERKLQVTLGEILWISVVVLTSLIGTIALCSILVDIHKDKIINFFSIQPFKREK